MPLPPFPSTLFPYTTLFRAHHRATGNQARGRIPKVTIYFISQEVADQKEISGYDGFNECRHLWTFRWESCPLQWAEGSRHGPLWHRLACADRSQMVS